MIRNPINTTPTTMVMLRDNDTPNTLMLSRCTAIAVHADGFDDDRPQAPTQTVRMTLTIETLARSTRAGNRRRGVM